MELSELAPVHTALSNGLRLIAIQLPALHRVVIDAHLRVGSRFETTENNGISHFVEHMIYRGSPLHPSAHAQSLAFERLGGTLVATTAADTGSMTIAVPPENFDEVVPIFADVFQQPLFTGIEIERGIVSEEIRESLDDEGHQVDPDNLIRQLVFQEHSLGMPITGTLSHLDGFDEAGLKHHHQLHYTARSTVIGVAGPIDPDRALASMEKQFKDLPAGTLVVSDAPAAQREPRFCHVRHLSSQTALRIGFRGPHCYDEQEAAAELLLRTIDDGMSTRLYQQICDQKGLCYDVSAGYESYEDAGLIELSAESTHERALDVLDEALSMIRRLRDEGPSAEELDKAKQRHRWQLREMLDSPEELTSFYGLSELASIPRTPLTRQAQLESVTREQVTQMAQRWLCRDNLNVVSVGMLPKKAQKKMAARVADFQ